MRLIATSERGDPILAVASCGNLLATGSVSGMVRIWYVDKSKKSPPALVETLCSRSDESIRQLIFLEKGTKLVAIVGDLCLKQWEFHRKFEPELKLVRWERTHHYASCQRTSTLVNGLTMALLSQGCAEPVFLVRDLSIPSQHILLDLHPEKVFTAQAAVVALHNQTVVVLDCASNGSVELVTLSIEDGGELNRISWRKGKFGRYWGCQIQKERLVMVSNTNKLTHWHLPTSRNTAPCKIDSISAHKGEILSFLLASDGVTLYSLGSEGTLKVWNELKCIQTYHLSPNLFSMRYPYVLKSTLHRELLLSCDIGVYKLALSESGLLL